MKRFKLIMMVPHASEIVVADAQAAHNEASRLSQPPMDGLPQAVVHSIEEIEDVVTEPIDFGFDENV